MNIVRISDGLGNQMFQYAFARKLQIMTGKKVCLDIRFINNEDMFSVGANQNVKGKLGYRTYGLEHFKIRLSRTDEHTLSKWNYLKQNNIYNKFVFCLAKEKRWFWNWVNEEVNFPKDMDELVRLKCPAYFQGYFFDLKYFDDIKPVLQREFCLKQPIRLSAELQRIMKKENTVSVHIRRGDFLKLNRDISQSNYYIKAIDLINNQVFKPFYLVFSDDIEWVKNNVKFQGEVVYVSDMGYEDYEEICIMKHCKHNIIANSTFSYWAAYLNANPDKIVICPKRWKTAIIPKTWISL